MKQALKRSKARIAEYEKKEIEAEEAKQAALLANLTDPAEKDKAVKLAEERVKAAKKARDEFERLQKKQQAKEDKIKKELERQKAQMSIEKSQLAMEKAKRRLKAKLEAEHKHAELGEQDRKERAERNARIVAEAVAKAGKRTHVKKIKIDLDEESEEDLQDMFDQFALKEKLYKAQWKLFIQKYKLCDGYKLSKSDLDLLYSKSVKKGKKALEFKEFCKAVAAAGNKRFPVKKNTDPNDAIARVLDATVRKHDPEEVAQRKKELRKMKKQYLKEQRHIEKREDNQHAKELEEERQKQLKKRKEREERIKQQMKQLEEDRVDHDKLMKKREQQEKRKKIKEEKELEKQYKDAQLALSTKAVEDEAMQKEAIKKAESRLKKFRNDAKEAAAKEEKLRLERAAQSQKLAAEGRERAQDRVAEMKAKEVHLGRADTNNLRTVFDHYISGNCFNRPDWMNCVTLLGLLDEILVKKSDLEQVFLDIKLQGHIGIDFRQFCSAMGCIAQLTHPGEEGNLKDNTSTKCLERLCFEIMGEVDDDDMEFDPTLDESYLEEFDLVETEEETAIRLAEEKEKKKARKQAKKKRDKEAQLKAEEEARVEAEKKKAKMEKIEKARTKAANRVLKRKKEKFTISEGNSENLRVFYDYFMICPGGMSRGDWLNFLSTLEVMDEEIIQKGDCEEVFDKMCKIKTRGLSFEEFGIGVSLLALRRYHDEQLNQTTALAQLIKELVNEGDDD